jgi:DMSO/TMAO reductase YedYZ heme-binding membrane subunit
MIRQNFNFKAASLFLLIGLYFFAIFPNAQAEDLKTIEYPDNVAVDQDLDGLTDEGEKQIFNTDPNVADSDGDGYLDGAEIIGRSSPLDATSPSPVQTITNTIQPKNNEIPWAWYSARAGGLVGFLLLYISIFLGLAIRMPVLRKIIKPVYSYNIHCWISLQALILAFIHSGSLLFDKYLNFGFIGTFIPFALSSDIVDPNLITLGILGLYLMIALVATSYGRKYISQKVWRSVHFTNVILYALVIVHAYYIGTDLKIPLIRNIFIGLNIFLIFLFLVNIISRISSWRRRDLEA